MSLLSRPLSLGTTPLRNRIMVSPMCTYSAAADGQASDWHLVHYGRLAIGGAGLVMIEATAVTPEGRHCYSDLGLWSDDHIAPLARIAGFIRGQGAAPAIQLQHAGRKASARRAWDGGAPLDETDLSLRGESAWQTAGPSPLALAPGKPVPRALGLDDLPALAQHYAEAARRAVAAGFAVIEVHFAHGYLLNQFLSPITNQRTDQYGGSLENRMRFPLQVIDAVQAAVAGRGDVWVRISAVDGVEGGWTLDESVILARALKAHGVAAIDVSSGGIGGAATMNRLARSPGFQVPFAGAIRRAAGIPTVAVGLILTPEQAERVLTDGEADLVAIGREALSNPNWPNLALTALEAGSYDHWAPNVGWWLERRAAILRDHAAGILP